MVPENESMAELKMRLGSFLAREKAKRNINLTQLSKVTGIPKTCLHNWESGIAPRLSDKNLQYLARLSKFFNVSVHFILFGTTEREVIHETLHEHTFEDGKIKYKVKIERLKI